MFKMSAFKKYNCNQTLRESCWDTVLVLACVDAVMMFLRSCQQCVDVSVTSAFGQRRSRPGLGASVEQLC